VGDAAFHQLAPHGLGDGVGETFPLAGRLDLRKHVPDPVLIAYGAALGLDVARALDIGQPLGKELHQLPVQAVDLAPDICHGGTVVGGNAVTVSLMRFHRNHSSCFSPTDCGYGG
jgi:hypothetical protein